MRTYKTLHIAFALLIGCTLTGCGMGTPLQAVSDQDVALEALQTSYQPRFEALTKPAGTEDEAWTPAPFIKRDAAGAIRSIGRPALEQSTTVLPQQVQTVQQPQDILPVKRDDQNRIRSIGRPALNLNAANPASLADPDSDQNRLEAMK